MMRSPAVQDQVIAQQLARADLASPGLAFGAFKALVWQGGSPPRTRDFAARGC
jgi:hypothetical protein